MILILFEANKIGYKCLVDYYTGAKKDIYKLYKKYEKRYVISRLLHK